MKLVVKLSLFGSILNESVFELPSKTRATADLLAAALSAELPFDVALYIASKTVVSSIEAPSLILFAPEIVFLVAVSVILWEATSLADNTVFINPMNSLLFVLNF